MLRAGHNCQRITDCGVYLKAGAASAKSDDRFDISSDMDLDALGAAPIRIKVFSKSMHASLKFLIWIYSYSKTPRNDFV